MTLLRVYRSQTPPLLRRKRPLECTRTRQLVRPRGPVVTEVLTPRHGTAGFRLETPISPEISESQIQRRLERLLTSLSEVKGRRESRGRRLSARVLGEQSRVVSVLSRLCRESSPAVLGAGVPVRPREPSRSHRRVKRPQLLRVSSTSSHPLVTPSLLLIPLR